MVFRGCPGRIRRWAAGCCALSACVGAHHGHLCYTCQVLLQPSSPLNASRRTRFWKLEEKTGVERCRVAVAREQPRDQPVEGGEGASKFGLTHWGGLGWGSAYIPQQDMSRVCHASPALIPRRRVVPAQKWGQNRGAHATKTEESQKGDTCPVAQAKVSRDVQGTILGYFAAFCQLGNPIML